MISYESQHPTEAVPRKLDAIVFGRTVYRCVSRYDWNESLKRLSVVIDTRKFLGIHWQAGLVGGATAESVEAYRQSCWYHNSFKPVFRGRLIMAGNAVVLEGSFSMFPSVRIFLGAWVAVWISVGIAGLVLNSDRIGTIFFTLVGLFFGALIVWIGKSLANADVRIIADAMDAALTT